MDFLQQLGPLALASRLKRLTEQLYRSGEKVYSTLEVEFEPRWFMVFARLKESGATALAITTIAKDLGVTHPGVIKLVREMESSGLAISSCDRDDARKRTIQLTNKGRRLAAELEPVWAAFEATTLDLFREIDGDLIALVDQLELRLTKTPFTDRVIDHLGGSPSPVEIVDFNQSLARQFCRMNEAWLCELFRIEAYDRRQLDDPKTEIIDTGGDIIFARLDGRIVGTTALIRLSARRMELAKMAVEEESRGQGIGTALLDAAVERARRLGATCLVLQTHPVHEVAVRLYQRRGFEKRQVRIPGAAKLNRSRGGFTMALDLKKNGRSRRKRK